MNAKHDVVIAGAGVIGLSKSLAAEVAETIAAVARPKGPLL